MTNLGKAIRALQTWPQTMSNKQMAKAIGIPESSLTRIKQGKLPDARGLAKLMNWLLRETQR